jgi:hypothetical protein
MADRYSARTQSSGDNMITQSSRRTGAGIRSLSVHSRGIVRAIKELWQNASVSRMRHAIHTPTYEFAIGDDGGIKLDPQCLRMLRRAITHFPVARLDRRFFAPGVSYRGLRDPLVLRGWVILQKDVLHAPETTRCKGCNLRLLRCWACYERFCNIHGTVW